MGESSMLPQSANAEPFEPRTLVILFKECPDSGATLGYYGTITRVLNSSVVKNPARPDLWIYRVFLPYFGRQFDIPARQLCVGANTDPANPSAEPICELQFDSPPTADNEEIHGAYRLPNRDWDYFVFNKCEQSLATYRLNMSIESPRNKPAKLCYNVPSFEVLDRDYVLRAIGDVIGVELSKST